MNITIKDNEYSLEQPRLKKWLEIEDIRVKIEKAADTVTFLDSYLGMVSAAVGIDIQDLEDIEWIQVSALYQQILLFQYPAHDFPIFKVSAKKDEKDWTYAGRSWYIWLHLLASNYGWDVEYISNLKIDDAIGLLHEILSDEYFEKEWEWGLSEVAYPYDPATKRANFKPLPRPEWMQTSIIEKTLLKLTKKVRIPRGMLPQGMVMQWDKNDNDKYEESPDPIQPPE